MRQWVHAPCSVAPRGVRHGVVGGVPCDQSVGQSRRLRCCTHLVAIVQNIMQLPVARGGCTRWSVRTILKTCLRHTVHTSAICNLGGTVSSALLQAKRRYTPCAEHCGTRALFELTVAETHISEKGIEAVPVSTPRGGPPVTISTTRSRRMQLSVRGNI